MPSSILCKNGTLIVHDENDIPKALKSDLLVKDGLIHSIGADLAPLDDSTVTLDCIDKIISPGFIDTHHHMWQSQLKGRFPDSNLIDYMVRGNLMSHFFTSEDVYWGVLSTALESIDAGVTTVVDHAHMSRSPAHVTRAIDATVESGLRSFFCYTMVPEIKSWSPEFAIGDPPLDWMIPQLQELATKNPFGPNGRVTLGFAFDALFLPTPVVQQSIGMARGLKLFPLTAHDSSNLFGASMIRKAHEHGVLASDWIFSHSSGTTESEVSLLTSAGAHISTTPATELQMAMPVVPIHEPGFKALRKNLTIGIDCNCCYSGDIVGQMRLLLQSSRGLTGNAFASRGKYPNELNLKTWEVFNMATIQAATALRINAGTIKEGAIADLVVFDATSPGMFSAATEDPVAAIVLHSSIRDVETVIVDGVIRKKSGVLLPVALENEKQIKWSNIVKEVARSRDEIDGRIKEAKLDSKAVTEGLLKAFHLPADMFE
ncbi:hypothetical protein DL96DRAFT_154509 [Flagelloscypha sp. PMI_526]|nr:hypothetical protein DL96DRAFT_154509 [Flagelloscypha sp. PMI_526]